MSKVKLFFLLGSSHAHRVLILHPINTSSSLVGFLISGGRGVLCWGLDLKKKKVPKEVSCNEQESNPGACLVTSNISCFLRRKQAVNTQI